MKLKIQFIFFLLLSFFFVKSQTIIQGMIKNEENKTLSYCAIGIKDTNVGTITDEKGFYKIIIPNEFQNKNVIIKAEGYLERI